MNKYMIIVTVLTALAFFAMAVYAMKLDVEAPIAGEETTAEATIEEETECIVLECTTLYDVPLTDELQIFIHEVCREYGVDFRLVLAMISVESSFRCNAYNVSTDCCGLMQISGINRPMLQEKLGVTDLFNAYENAMGGIYLLRQALNYDGDTEHALMIYNCGIGGAKKLFYKGVHSTEYSRKVLEVRENLKVRERIYEEI